MNVSKIKKKAVIITLIIISGVYVFTASNVQKEVFDMFLGGVASFSLLTILFFVVGMLKEESWKEKIKPYAIVFGLLLAWTIVFAALRIALHF